jgi:hypothetical protein
MLRSASQRLCHGGARAQACEIAEVRTGWAGPVLTRAKCSRADSHD